mgnify:CR=1 FL=1
MIIFSFSLILSYSLVKGVFASAAISAGPETNEFLRGKLHFHSHLYTSQNYIDFPGRIFEIKRVFPYSKQEMKTNLGNTKANITTRNFPDSVEEIRKKWRK